MKKIIDSLNYKKQLLSFASGEQIVHIIEYSQNNNNLTLLISKTSEALNPLGNMNHIGDGGTINDFLKIQKKVRFIINGGFSHYRKNYYQWKNQDFNVGDPVGLVKIRNHLFEDWINSNNYGFLAQKTKQDKWVIKNKVEKNEKYILGCTPLLIHEGNSVNIPEDLMKPMEKGLVNPPSILGHGYQSHPRTAVGEKNGSLFFILVEGLNNGGCTLPELQEIGVRLNLESMLNLDGGGSSQFKLLDNDTFIQNNISDEDKERVLGHLLVIFDESLDN